MPTIGDVARRAGVSVVTVSRVINGARNVRPVTRQRVEQAIQELGYVPSVAARSLRSRRTRSLALVVPDITNVFWTTVARGVEDAAHRHGYSVLLCNTDESLSKQSRYLDVVASHRVDGVIIAPCDCDGRNLRRLRDQGIPTVLVDRRVEGWEVDSVCGDSVAGARALVRHLLALGHQRIATISGPRSTSTAADRVAGYCIALAEAGLSADPRLVRWGEYRAEAGERLCEALLAEGLAPTAIFAANNVIAMGVIAALGRRGLSIPRDVALVSFDDLPDASHLFPFLTVAVQPAHDMGLQAAALLLSRLEAPPRLEPRRVVLPVCLIVRRSCGSGGVALSLPLAARAPEQSYQAPPLTPEERRRYAAWLESPGWGSPDRDGHPFTSAKEV